MNEVTRFVQKLGPQPLCTATVESPTRMIFDALIGGAGSVAGWACAAPASAAAAIKLILNIGLLLLVLDKKTAGPRTRRYSFTHRPRDQKIIRAPSVMIRPVLA
jgi:hypothetical protein